MDKILTFALAAVLAVYGLVNLIAKDTAWDLREYFNSLRGRASERTKAWETMRVIVGIVCLVMALAIVADAAFSQALLR